MLNVFILIGISLLQAIAAIATITSSSGIFSGQIVANTTLENSAFVSLASTRTELKSPITRNGTFAFEDLDVGEYVMSIRSRKALFQMYHVEVTPSNHIDVRLYSVGYGALPSKPFQLPLVIPSIGVPVYVEAAEPFSIVKIFRANPLLLAGVVAIICLAALPKLLAALDPETAEEVMRNQSEMHARLQSFGGTDLASSLSKRLAATDDRSTSSASSKPSTASMQDSKPSSKGSKKRKQSQDLVLE